MTTTTVLLFRVNAVEIMHLSNLWYLSLGSNEIFSNILTSRGRSLGNLSKLQQTQYYQQLKTSIINGTIITMSCCSHRYPSLSSIAPGRSSRQYSCPYRAFVLAGRPTLARPCEGVHTSSSLISSSLIFQQYLACLVRLI